MCLFTGCYPMNRFDLNQIILLDFYDLELISSVKRFLLTYSFAFIYSCWPSVMAIPKCSLKGCELFFCLRNMTCGAVQHRCSWSVPLNRSLVPLYHRKVESYTSSIYILQAEWQAHQCCGNYFTDGHMTQTPSYVSYDTIIKTMIQDHISSQMHQSI
jgi:hypothetical protein